MKLLKKNKFLYLIIFILSFVVYGNTLQNNYCLDDIFVIKDNELVQKGISGIPEIFSSPYSQGKNRTYGYRPIAKSTFAVEYSIFGENPKISHFINIFLFAVSCLILFKLLLSFFKSYSHWLSFFIIILFVTHPVHTEVVASLKNREEILSFLGGIVSLYLFYKATITKKLYYIIFGILALVTGYLSKESAMVFIALIPLSLYFFTNIKLKDLAVITISTFVIIYITRTIISFLVPVDKTMMFFENPLFYINKLDSVVLMGLSTLYEYSRLLFFPHPLVYYYGYNMIPFTEWLSFRIIFSFIFHLFIFIYALLNLKEKKIISFGILFYLIAISMFTNIVTPVSGIVGERLVFTASLGFCIVIVYLLFQYLSDKNRKFKPNYKIVMVLLVFIIPYSVKTMNRNKAWKDDLTLFETDINNLKNSAKANVLYAGTLLSKIRDTGNNLSVTDKRQKLEKAVELYKQGIKIYPEYTNALKNLGNIYFAYYKNNTLAIKYYNDALNSDSSNVEILLNLGFVYEVSNRNPKAEQCYKKALRIDSLNINALSLLANYYNKKGNINKAIKYNEKIMLIDSLTDLPYINIGNYYLQKQDTVKAVEFWEQAIKKVPDNPKLQNQLYRYFLLKKDQDKAAYYFNINK